MPELPEVETVKCALSNCLPGRQFVKAETFIPVMRYPLEVLHTPELLHTPIAEVRRRARYLILELANRLALVMHLGMSGVIRVEPYEVPRRKHEHVILKLDDGMAFRFECTRRFSSIRLCTLPQPGAEPELLAGLGPEPLTDVFSGDYFYRMTRHKSGCIKNVLMDNAVVVGIGNIYAAETLFDAGISPLRPADALSREECERLVASAKTTLHKAIAAGGSTIADYRHVDGSEGKFAQQLMVYGRRNQPCRRCGAAIRQERLGGRSSCFCPECQH
ncbi:bifunctional DNA-formamidopyrimidine glycosylase/DNA-(apurinic or apyrimidinic site) lyase [Victivallis sp. Marseille-Q1083]|uniref:bifunctional DNA-formamidopyrimidine glycosylase/DNA-(apurinic or apyrimidinic site) lyase n=1 Tax=Victivallis sp. Marseille-Q1083 TaxID=2717288 RepID=UPI00158DE263|nr:bifunctional DNA-formamidopyrimidine glycosylase/DNA-(apurinic or apyrimidinic site) lyase [Victivallis sp. Marseille-Q1083]